MLSELVPGGIPKELTVSKAVAVQGRAQPQTAVDRARDVIAGELWRG